MKKKEHKIKYCWNCKRSLDFHEFRNRNSQLTEKRALYLWYHPNIELLCCGCYAEEIHQSHVQNGVPNHVRSRKILVMGLPDTGKTAIVSSIISKRLDLQDFLPTKGCARKCVTLNDTEYNVWDLGGAHGYRRTWLDRSELIFSEASEMIYTINLQEHLACRDSIKYLREIVDNYDLNRLGCNFRVWILFHKADPEILNTLRGLKYSELLLKKIDRLQIPCRYEIYKTSLHYFKERYSETLYNDADTFGSLIVSLFSPPSIII